MFDLSGVFTSTCTWSLGDGLFIVAELVLILGLANWAARRWLGRDLLTLVADVLDHWTGRP